MTQRSRSTIPQATAQGLSRRSFLKRTGAGLAGVDQRPDVGGRQVGGARMVAGPIEVDRRAQHVALFALVVRAGALVQRKALAPAQLAVVERLDQRVLPVLAPIRAVVRDEQVAIAQCP